MKTFQQIEIPKRLRTRPKDRRGYPVPFIAMIDANKRPHFTVSDHAKVMHVVKKKACGLCGGRLKEGAWFIGGSRCFLDPMGAFIDPAMHEECARYAIQVCPYLGAPSYARRIDDRTLSDKAIPEGVTILNNVAAMPDDRPMLFGMGKCNAYEKITTGKGAEIFRAVGGWHDIKWWQHGAKMEGEALNQALAADRMRWK